MGPTPKAVLVKIVHSGPELCEEILVTRADGSEERAIFQCWTDGTHDKSLLNGKAVRGGARWEGDELVIESCVRVGTTEMYFCDCWSVSSDGQTLSMEHRKGSLAGQLTILDRTA